MILFGPNNLWVPDRTTAILVPGRQWDSLYSDVEKTIYCMLVVHILLL